MHYIINALSFVVSGVTWVFFFFGIMNYVNIIFFKKVYPHF